MSVWFHGASLGELEHARGIWEFIPDFGVTFTSKSVGQKSDPRARFWERLSLGFLPISGNITENLMLVSMVNEIQPFVIWRNGKKPWVMADCHTCGNLAHHPMKNLLHRAARIFCQTEQDAEKLAAFNPVVNGNSRVDRVLERAKNLESSSFQREWFDSYRGKILVLGSVYAEDMNVIFGDVKQLISEGWGVIVAPHVKNRSLVDGFTQTQNYSEENWNPKIPVIYVDVFGKLFSLYQKANVVYVGAKKRIHSILEPAAFGVQLLGAPRYSNSPEAIQMAADGFFHPISKPDQLYQKVVSGNFENPKKWMDRSRGAGLRVANFIKSVKST